MGLRNRYCLRKTPPIIFSRDVYPRGQGKSDWLLSLLNFEVLHYKAAYVFTLEKQGGRLLNTH